MIQDKSIKAVEVFLESAKESFASFAGGFDVASCAQAAEIILESQAAGGRIHVTGIGKPGHVAAYVASLLSSTGNLDSSLCFFQPSISHGVLYI